MAQLRITGLTLWIKCMRKQSSRTRIDSFSDRNKYFEVCTAKECCMIIAKARRFRRFLLSPLPCGVLETFFTTSCSFEGFFYARVHARLWKPSLLRPVVTPGSCGVFAVNVRCRIAGGLRPEDGVAAYGCTWRFICASRGVFGGAARPKNLFISVL